MKDGQENSGKNKRPSHNERRAPSSALRAPSPGGEGDGHYLRPGVRHGAGNQRSPASQRGEDHGEGLSVRASEMGRLPRRTGRSDTAEGLRDAPEPPSSTARLAPGG